MTSKRPGFADISTKLSLPNIELLKWSEEDKAVQAGSDKLGGDVLSAKHLYTDLQLLYNT